MIAAVADSVVSVAIQGETGTGKELVARAIHFHGPRSKRRFVPVNCAALPESLLESELFGYRKGAFTGAARSTPGLFHSADGGTIFLDEIADMAPALQAKLLRVLETGEVRRLGATDTQEVDVRVISASNKDLDAEMRSGRFREDLYYRLKGVTIRVPPLRDRRDDIPLLATHFLSVFGKSLGKSVGAFSSDAMSYLQEREWRGNVRELEHVVEAAVALCQGHVIAMETVMAAAGDREFSDSRIPRGNALTLREAQRDLEKRMLLKTYETCEGNVSETARRLGLARQQVQRIIKRYGITLVK